MSINHVSTGRYRKKPVEIEALQYTGYNHDAVMFFTKGQAVWSPREGKLTIPTLEGDHIAGAGDWIIRGVKGEYYPCKPATFEMTYEPVEEESMTAQSASKTSDNHRLELVGGEWERFDGEIKRGYGPYTARIDYFFTREAPFFWVVESNDYPIATGMEMTEKTAMAAAEAALLEEIAKFVRVKDVT